MCYFMLLGKNNPSKKLTNETRLVKYLSHETRKQQPVMTATNVFIEPAVISLQSHRGN